MGHSHKLPTNIDCAFCSSRIHSIFSALDSEEMSELRNHKSCSHYKKGQYIFTENGFPLGLYCVNSGKVKLSAQGLDGKEQILRLAKSGDVLGYRALLSNERYHSSAVALEDSSICFIPKDYFLEMVNKSPRLCFQIMQKISSDLKTAEEHIMALSQKNVRERLAEALLFFKATYGFESDGQTLAISLSREEIADYVGTSTESAIRLLSEFNQDKLIELSGKKIKLLNVPKLLSVANLNA